MHHGSQKCRSSIREAAGVHVDAIPDALAVAVKNAQTSGCLARGPSVRWNTLCRETVNRWDRVLLILAQAHRSKSEHVKTCEQLWKRLSSARAGHPASSRREQAVESDQMTLSRNELPKRVQPVHMPDA